MMRDLKFKIVSAFPSDMQKVIDDISKDFQIVEVSVNPIVLKGHLKNNIILSGYVSYTEKENDKESVTWEGKGKLVWIPEEKETNE